MPHRESAFVFVASSVLNPRAPAANTASWKICDQDPLIRLRSSCSCPIKSSLSSIVMASDCRRRLTSLTAVRVLYQIVVSNTNSKVDNHFFKALAWLSYSLVKEKWFIIDQDFFFFKFGNRRNNNLKQKLKYIQKNRIKFSKSFLNYQPTYFEILFKLSANLFNQLLI